MTQNTIQRISSVLNICLVFLVAFILSIKLQEFFSVNVVLLSAAVVYLLKNVLIDKSNPRWNALDLAVITVVGVELITFLGSSYKSNSEYYLIEVWFLLLWYWLLRQNLRLNYQRMAICAFLSVWAAFLSVVGFLNLYSLRRNLTEFGFRDITDFKYRIDVLNPVGLSIGEWSTTLLILLPFPIGAFIRFSNHRVLKWVFGATTAALLAVNLLTFIRGVYVAAAAFFVVGTILFGFYRLFSWRQVLAFDALVLIAAALILAPFYRPVMTTAAMMRTVSQARSLQGRQNIWKNSLQLIEQHPWLGIGANNFSMQYVSIKRPEEESGIALRPFNSFLQILIEKGLLGVLAYSFLIVAFFLVSHKKLKRSATDPFYKGIIILFMAAYAAVMVRDLTESSVFINRGAQALLWFMFAHNASDNDFPNPSTEP